MSVDRYAKLPVLWRIINTGKSQNYVSPCIYEGSRFVWPLTFFSLKCQPLETFLEASIESQKDHLENNMINIWWSWWNNVAIPASPTQIARFPLYIDVKEKVCSQHKSQHIPIYKIHGWCLDKLFSVKSFRPLSFDRGRIVLPCELKTGGTSTSQNHSIRRLV